VAEAAAAQFEQRRERAFNRIALLAGMGPADLKLAPAALRRIEAPPVNTGLPSELLCRRPDVRRAEAQLRSADFDVRALRMNLLPSFSLVTETGIGAQHLALLTGPNAFFYLLSATFAQTVFDGGRKKYQLENARAKHLEMLEQYAGALLTAVREVEDALATKRLTAEQYSARLAQVSAARGNYELNRRIYQVGAADRLALLDAEQRLFAAEELSEEALHDRMQAAIDLYKALGGGSRSEGKDPCAP
jgi:outer membrane protein TolC